MKIEIKEENTPVSHPVKKVELTIVMGKKDYSEPKLFIPKGENGRASVAPKKTWYVSFYLRNQNTGVLNEKFTYTKGINKLKTVRERKLAGNALRDGYSEALRRGWRPERKGIQFTASKNKTSQKIHTLSYCMDKAMEIKKRAISESTYDNYMVHKNSLIKWASANNLAEIDIKFFTIDYFYQWLDYLRFEYRKEDGQPLSGTSINNSKRAISALFTTLKKDRNRYLDNNFIKDIPNFDSEPVNNKAFSYLELKRIKDYLQEKDPYLIDFISFLLYTLLRPKEICRLKVKDINTDEWYLMVKTKTNPLAYKRIIDKMKPVLQRMNIKDEPGDFELFSNINKPKDWSHTKLKSRVDHFGRRFREIKKELGYGREYGIYSFRHTAIMDLYESLQEQGLQELEILSILMPITGHQSDSGIKNYLRNLKLIMPPDHSEIYNIDF